MFTFVETGNRPIILNNMCTLIIVKNKTISCLIVVLIKHIEESGEFLGGRRI